jgi:methionine synthase II (cobalamin-independent)
MAQATAEPRWTRPILVDGWRLAAGIARTACEARGLPPLPVKACTVGPYTMGRASEPGGRSRERLTLALAEAIGQEVRALVDAGAPIVQVDENALTRIGQDDAAERDLAARALDRLCEAVADRPGAHLSLAVSGGSAAPAGPDLFFERPVASYLFDLILGPDDWRLAARAPSDRGLLVGVADARSDAPDAPDDEPVMVWAGRYAASLGGRGPERVGLAPSAGLEQRTPERARSIIGALARAARATVLPSTVLRGELDPRAVTRADRP